MLRKTAKWTAVSCAVASGLLVAAVVAGAFYLDARGKREWQAYQAEAKAAGEPLDPASIIPPEIPDDENLAATPLFKPLFDSAAAGGAPASNWSDSAVRKTLEAFDPSPGGRQPVRPRWLRGEFLDPAALLGRSRQKGRPAGTPATQPSLEEVFQALGATDEQWVQLKAALTRPKARFPVRYQDGFGAAMPHVQALLDLGQLAALKALAEQAAGRPEAAGEDVLIALQVADALRDEPSLVSMSVRYAGILAALQPVWEGLARREWSQEQLAAFEAHLRSVNLVDHYVRAIRGERTVTGFSAIDMASRHAERIDSAESRLETQIRFGMRKAPQGWFDLNKAALGRMCDMMIRSADGKSVRFHPDATRNATAEAQKWDAERPIPVHMLAMILAPAPVEPRCAEGQTTTHLAVLAIALERHRLQRGEYPADLSELGVGVPHDVATGSPPHYARTDNGFQLYYDGWNCVDDGGKSAWKDAELKRLDYRNGDCVWPQPTAQPTAQAAL